MLEKLKSRRDGGGPQSSAEAFAQFDAEQPERSAAMTLGMLSSGGMMLNTAAMFGGAMMTSGRAGMDLAMNDGSGVNEYQMDTTAVNGGPASPFSQIFGGGGASIMDLPENLDWAAWDQYIQNGNSLDQSLQYFPGQFDASTPSVPPDLQMHQSNPYGDSVFMGANTPGRH